MSLLYDCLHGDAPLALEVYKDAEVQVLQLRRITSVA